MLQIELSDSERADLRAVLESTLSDLRMEIADTERLAYRDRLKQQRDVVARVLDAVAAGS